MTFNKISYRKRKPGNKNDTTEPSLIPAGHSHGTKEKDTWQQSGKAEQQGTESADAQGG